MSYFYKEPPPGRSPRRREGKSMGAKEVPAKVFPHRDDVVDTQIENMQAKADHFILKNMGDEVKFKSKAQCPLSARQHENNVFAPPRLDTPPKRRIRPGVSDEDLKKIWAEDDVKDRAQKAMENQPTIVEKMLGQDYPPRKLDKDLLHKRTVDVKKPDANTAEPEGFKGMGAQCDPPARRGVMCKPVIDFTPPEFIKKERKSGRRTIFPPDTFSFQDEHQVFRGQTTVE